MFVGFSFSLERVKPKKSHTIALSILTGVLIGTSYIPFPGWWVAVAWVPLLSLWTGLIQQNEFRLRDLFWSGWIAQFTLSLIGFHWIKTTAVEFGHFPEWAGILVLLAFASLAHLYFPLSGLMSAWLLKKLGLSIARIPGLFLISAACWFVFLESIWPSIFPWHLGYTWLWMQWPGAQLAEWIGFEGINLLILASNFVIAFSLMQRNRRVRIGAAFVALIVFVLVPQGIASSLQANERAKWTHSIQALIVQGNVGNFDKLIAERQADFALPLIEKYLRLSSAAKESYGIDQIDVAVWPETAFANYLNSHLANDRFQSTLYQGLRSIDPLGKITWLTGAYSRPQNSTSTFNGLFAIQSNLGLLYEPYHKSVLIPFGEKFPFSDWIPYQKWLFPGLGSFGQGPGPVSWIDPASRVNFGPQICLESLYPRFAAGASRLGADILVNITNDSWFGRTFEPYQHLTMTAARAVETRRPLIRSTNTGISTVILSDGSQLTHSPIDREWFHLYRVPFAKDRKPTVYARIAGYSPFLSGLIFALALIFALVRRHGTKGK